LLAKSVPDTQNNGVINQYNGFIAYCRRTQREIAGQRRSLVSAANGKSKSGGRSRSGGGGSMNKKVIYAFIILGLTALVLVYNSIGLGRNVTVDLIFTSITAMKSLVFFGFIVVGVIIGVLIK
jgi:uncharacterized integral membrane protein